MKIDLKNLQSGINPSDLFKKISCFIMRKEACVLLAILIMAIGYCGYLWYGYAYEYQWDEVRKQEYMNTKKASATFNKTKFEKVLRGITARQDEYQKNIDTKKDIFKLK
ncbi:MAG: hypothetical protein Q7T51_02180 [Candidatus Moranbacteria bacterium]|nr:hypothetical protein [Candidatus Moranbacteria bacterium]